MHPDDNNLGSTVPGFGSAAAGRDPTTDSDLADRGGGYLAPKLVFVHIMKTAGTSLYRWLQRHYPHEDILTEATNWAGYWNLPPEVRDRKRFVRGHFGSYITKFYNAADGFKYITVLRDPVDRAISHYFHGKSAPDSGRLGKVIREQNLSLDDFLEHPVCARFAHNFQVRNLAYDLDADYATQKLSPGQFFKGPMGDADLKLATKFLSTVDLIGFTDRLPEFVASLSESMGFFPDEQLGRSRGYREGGSAPSPDTIKKIRKANELDIELYEWARSQVQKAKPKIALGWRGNRQPNPIDLSDGVLHHWRVMDPFFGTGWSDVQSPDSVGVPAHRWMIDSECATLRIRVDPHAKYRMLLEIGRFVRAEQRDHFSILANGTTLALIGPAHSEHASEGGGLFVATIDATGKDECELQFRVKTLSSFHKVNSNDTDQTLRGMALCAITFIRADPSMHTEKSPIQP